MSKYRTVYNIRVTVPSRWEGQEHWATKHAPDLVYPKVHYIFGDGTSWVIVTEDQCDVLSSAVEIDTTSTHVDVSYTYEHTLKDGEDG